MECVVDTKFVTGVATKFRPYAATPFITVEPLAEADRYALNPRQHTR